MKKKIINMDKIVLKSFVIENFTYLLNFVA